MKRIAAVLFLLFASLGCVLAEPAAPVFTLQTAAGTTVTGPLRELGENWTVRVGDKRVDGKDLVALRRGEVPLPPFPTQEQLLFVNGDRVPGKVRKVADEQVTVQFDAAATGIEREVQVPLSALAVIWLGAPDGTEQPERLRRRLATEQRSRDVVLLRNGDAVDGIVTGVDEKNVQVEADKKTVPVARDKVAAIALSTELATPLKPKGSYARLTLAGGCRLSLASAACTDGTTLTGTTLFDAPVRIAVDRIVALAVHQGAAVYLSDLKPLRYEFTPYLGVSYPCVNDGGVTGLDLRLAGSTHDKGLGTHSECRVTYDVSGGYRRFEALVGLDERTGVKGSVRVRVLLDGKPQDISGDRDLTSRDGAVPVRVDLAGAKEMTLVVEFGQRGDVGDHVNWADARLIK